MFFCVCYRACLMIMAFPFSMLEFDGVLLRLGSGFELTLTLMAGVIPIMAFGIFYEHYIIFTSTHALEAFDIVYTPCISSPLAQPSI